MGMQSTNGANGTPVEFKGMPDKSAFANIKGKVDKATATTAFSNWISTSNFPGV
ncbi:MAG: hypothetical protein KAH32_07560 [Chlamydiia bacterium]|nr:hypothetical protein [Chlamydiia bacterium]